MIEISSTRLLVVSSKVMPAASVPLPQGALGASMTVLPEGHPQQQQGKKEEVKS